MVIGDKTIGETLEKLFGTADLCHFYLTHFQALHCSLGFSHKVDVLYLTLMEHDRPVRRIMDPVNLIV